MVKTEQYLDISEYITELQDDLGMQPGKNSVRIARWIFDALREIQMHYHHHLERTSRVLLEGSNVAKPRDLLIVRHVYLVNDAGKCEEPLMDESIECCRRSVSTVPKMNNITVNDQAGRYVFSSNVTETDFTHALIVYLSAPLDEQGMPMVWAFAKEGVSAYVQLRHLKRKRSFFQAANTKKNPIPLSEIETVRRDWENKRSEARVSMIGPSSPRELLEVGDRWIYGAPFFPMRISNYKFSKRVF